ncbi:hypothetical protein PG911_11680 [Tenacibaculum ovolyticum]|uniref:hypothetical protein n=1 Tax=Tenacibaculum ovolyticum TaxID=104270 RepID=UPI0022F39DF3|nr:hypothetical protein [Tenacibaculum ovolyticum]WBX75316.1 hypothetical protein PG911_11680 [Tenacibaculum ovolyticum]
MKFKSIEQVKSEFGLNSNEQAEIKSELKRKLAESHPDKVGETNFDSEYFEKIKSGLDFLTKTTTTELVTTEQVTDLIQIVKELTTKNSSDTAEKQFSDSLDNYYKERKEALLIPKISLSVITGVLSFLWLFPQTVQDHPILSKYINFENSASTLIWFVLLLYTIIFWIMISRKERREKNLSKRLKTERIQNKILVDFKRENNDEKFIKSDLTESILDKYSFRKQPSILTVFMGRAGIEQETAENLANYIIGKAESKDLIKEVKESQTLDELYEWKK